MSGLDALNKKFKQLKSTLLFLLLVFIIINLTFWQIVRAATTDFTATANVTISEVVFGAGETTLVIISGSTAEEIETGDELTVTNPGSQFRVGSADSAVKTIVVTLGGSTVACVVNSAPGTSYASLPTTAGTYLVAPSSVTSCPSDGSEAPVSRAHLRQPKMNVAVQPLVAAPIAGSLSSNNALFLSTLSLGSASFDVRRLQTLLSSDPSIYPEGTVSGFFGPLTRRAVERFQVKYGVAKPGDLGFGVVGPATRAKLQEVYQATSPAQAQPVTTEAVLSALSGSFERNLLPGSSSQDVRRLQVLLATDNSLYPEGTVSGFFGPLTRKAVERFQVKYGVAKPGDLGFGVVGPATRAKLQEVF